MYIFGWLSPQIHSPSIFISHQLLERPLWCRSDLSCWMLTWIIVNTHPAISLFLYSLRLKLLVLNLERWLLVSKTHACIRTKSQKYFSSSLLTFLSELCRSTSISRWLPSASLWRLVNPSRVLWCSELVNLIKDQVPLFSELSGDTSNQSWMISSVWTHSRVSTR